MNGPNGNDRRMQLIALSLAIGIVVVLILAAMCSPARAGELHYSWTQPSDGPTPTGYKVYIGMVNPPTVEEDVGLVLEKTYPALQDCGRYHFGVKAYNGAAESAMSDLVSVYPRPSITDVVDSQTGTHTILGNNFDVNLKVFVDYGAGFVQLPPAEVNRESCTEIRIPDVPLLRVQVANVALPLGSGEPVDIFSQPWPGPVVLVD